MAILKHALLAFGLQMEGARVKSIVDIESGQPWGVKELPTRIITNLVFWASGEAGESFTWSFATAGPQGNGFNSGPIPAKFDASGDTNCAAQVPIFVTEEGEHTVRLMFADSVVWTRSLWMIRPLSSPRIQ